MFNILLQWIMIRISRLELNVCEIISCNKHLFSKLVVKFLILE